MKPQTHSQLIATKPPVFTPVRGGLLQRKCACGNLTVAGGECAECAKNKSGLQRKLSIGASNDPMELEADRVADQVMAAPLYSVVNTAPPRIQRFSGQSTEGTEFAPASVESVLASSGRPLEPTLRQDMELRFGYDFSRVRVHSGAAAEQSARDMSAKAYTVGHDLVFSAGRYAPGTQEGQHLIVHELTHVVQQNASYFPHEIVQRSPDNKPPNLGSGVPEDLLLWSIAVWPKHLDHDQEILMLAANPDHAHRRWEGLRLPDQIGVAVNMARFYGGSFAKKFADIHNTRGVPETIFEQVDASTPSSKLTARGFQLAGTQAQMNVEIWFHPAGTRLHRPIRPQPPPKPIEPEHMPVPESEPEDEETETVPVEEADLTEGQRKALTLLQQMEHMNEEFRKMLDAAKTTEFMEKEPQFRTLREQLHQLVLEDDSLSEPEFDFFSPDRKAAVEAFIQLRNRAYGTDLGDWERIENRTR